MADALYDPRSMLPAGQVLDRVAQDGLMAAYAANGGQPLTAAQAAAAVGPALPFPAFLRRLPDSNPQGPGAPWTPAPAGIVVPLPSVGVPLIFSDGSFALFSDESSILFTG